MRDMEPGMRIIGGIANIADAAEARLTRSELAAILSLFGLRTAKSSECEDISGLIKKALDLYA